MGAGQGSQGNLQYPTQREVQGFVWMAFQLFVFTAHILDKQKHFISFFPRDLALLVLHKKPFLLLGLAAEPMIGIWNVKYQCPACVWSGDGKEFLKPLCALLSLSPSPGSAQPSAPLPSSVCFRLGAAQISDPNPKPHEQFPACFTLSPAQPEQVMQVCSKDVQVQ